MARYWTGAHTKHRLRFHLVWIPKYRKRVLRGKIAARIKQLLYEACKVNNWLLSEINVQEDHVHILVQIWPRESVADVVKRLKGGKSRVSGAGRISLGRQFLGRRLFCRNSR